MVAFALALVLALGVGATAVGVRLANGVSPLSIVWEDASFHVSTQITQGTNHVYFYGDAAARVMDPVIRQWNDKTASRLHHEMEHPGTVVWVRFEHPDLGTRPPAATGPTVGRSFPRFRALLGNSTNSLIQLEGVGNVHDYRHSLYVCGWLVPGLAASHSGETIQVELTNGVSVATLRFR